MPSSYSIIQYVPDPVIDERVNIGVVVIGGERPICQFLHRWRRVWLFGRENTKFLREFAREVESACSPQGRLGYDQAPLKLDAEVLQTMVANWANTIQLTPARASLLPPEKLIQNIASRYLVEPDTKARQYLDRRVAANWTIRSVKEIVTQENVPHEFVHPWRLVEGASGRHKFDIALGNGKPWFLAHGLSFESPAQDREVPIQLLLWGVRDVKDAFPELPIGVAVVPPRTRNLSDYQDVKSKLADFGANVVEARTEEDVLQQLRQVLRPDVIAEHRTADSPMHAPA